MGKSGRGTEEMTGAPPCDLLIGTLGKAFGVNGGYVVSNRQVIRFLRETSPMYIYSNPDYRRRSSGCAALSRNRGQPARARTPGQAAHADAALRERHRGSGIRDHSR